MPSPGGIHAVALSVSAITGVCRNWWAVRVFARGTSGVVRWEVSLLVTFASAGRDTCGLNGAFSGTTMIAVVWIVRLTTASGGVVGTKAT